MREVDMLGVSVETEVHFSFPVWLGFGVSPY